MGRVIRTEVKNQDFGKAFEQPSIQNPPVWPTHKQLWYIVAFGFLASLLFPFCGPWFFPSVADRLFMLAITTMAFAAGIVVQRSFELFFWTYTKGATQVLLGIVFITSALEMAALLEKQDGMFLIFRCLSVFSLGIVTRTLHVLRWASVSTVFWNFSLLAFMVVPLIMNGLAVVSPWLSLLFSGVLFVTDVALLISVDLPENILDLMSWYRSQSDNSGWSPRGLACGVSAGSVIMILVLQQTPLILGGAETNGSLSISLLTVAISLIPRMSMSNKRMNFIFSHREDLYLLSFTRFLACTTFVYTSSLYMFPRFSAETVAFALPTISNAALFTLVMRAHLMETLPRMSKLAEGTLLPCLFTLIASPLLYEIVRNVPPDIRYMLPLGLPIFSVILGAQADDRIT